MEQKQADPNGSYFVAGVAVKSSVPHELQITINHPTFELAYFTISVGAVPPETTAPECQRDGIQSSLML